MYSKIQYNKNQNLNDYERKSPSLIYFVFETHLFIPAVIL